MKTRKTVSYLILEVASNGEETVLHRTSSIDDASNTFKFVKSMNANKKIKMVEFIEY